MTEKERFIDIFNYLATKYPNLSMDGNLVLYNGEIHFNIDGYNLAYNLYRLTSLMEYKGEFI